MSQNDHGLGVSGLTVENSAGHTLLDGVSFSLAAGERLGLIGESGSGKSLTALAIMGLLPEGLRASGSIALDDTELVGASEQTMVPLRGRDVAIVFQEPLTALDPLMRVGRQIAEPIVRGARRNGIRLDRREADRAVLDAMAEVSLPNVERLARAYPHEISGGQRQRVAIAVAIAQRPRILIADEPTTALDVTIQAEILELLDGLVRDRGMSLLFISHDLAVVSRVAPRVAVLKDGVVVETGLLAELIAAPQHPYTREFVESARELERALDWESEG